MEWKPLVYKEFDLSDRYMISDTGEIYSTITKKTLKQTLNKSTGYKGVVISVGSRSKKKLLKTHIAVAYNFVDGYKDGLVVNHKDGNKQNNCYNNLEWITQKQNAEHAIQNNLMADGIKIKCVNTGEIFNSITDASLWCGLSRYTGSIRDYLKDKNRKSAGRHPLTNEPLQWELV